MLTPEEIEAREFLVSVRGYDRDEVHAFLSEIAQQLRRAPKGKPSSKGGEDPSAMFAQIGKETQRILEAAQEAGSELKRQAKQEADRELKDARARADKMIADGERRREQLESELGDLKAERIRLAEELRAVGRTLEKTLRTLTADDPASSVRQALTAAPPAPDEARSPAPDEARSPAPDEARSPAPAPAAPLVSEEMPIPDEAAAPADRPHAKELPEDLDDAEDGQSLRAQALAPLHPKLVRKVKRGLQDLQNAALDRLRRAGGGADANDFLPTDEEVRIVGLMATEFLDEAYAAGVSAATELAGRPLPEPNEPRNLEQEFVAEVAERIRSPLGATLRMGLSAGQSGAELNDRMGAVFGELKSAVAEELAASHLIYAYESGMLDTWAAGGVAARRWVLGKEPRCPEARCRHNDQGGVLPLDQVFPSGHQHPPVHAGCNCTTLPVLEGAALNS